MVTVHVTASATVTFTMEIDEEHLIDQSIKEYVEFEMMDSLDEAEIESIDGLVDVGVE
jgi:hypothetical protein